MSNSVFKKSANIIEKFVVKLCKTSSASLFNFAMFIQFLSSFEKASWAKFNTKNSSSNVIVAIANPGLRPRKTFRDRVSLYFSSSSLFLSQKIMIKPHTDSQQYYVIVVK